MTQRDDLLGRLKELHTGTKAHRATSRVIRAMIFDGDYAGATTALDTLEDALHPALAAEGGGPVEAPLVLDPEGEELGNIALSITGYDDTPDIIHLDDDGGFALSGGHILGSEFGHLTINAETDSLSGPPNGGAVLEFKLQDRNLLVVSPGAGYNVIVGGAVANDRLLSLFAFTAQSANLFEAYDENGNDPQFRINFAGIPVLAVHAAPADGDLAAGDCALWFDQTNGAAKLMVKAKQADGTVKTGQVALA